jgi:hypothetical protein
MVALPIEPETPPEPPRTPGSGPLAAVVLAWRHVVTRVFALLATARSRIVASRPASVAAMTVRYLRDPAGTLASADEDGRARLKEAGAAALALGVTVSFLVPGLVGAPVVRRFLAAGWTAAWALGRLFIMRVVARGELRTHPPRVDDAWGPALLPYAAAVIDPLPLVALAVSAALTLTGLQALGTDRDEARRVVGIAFGAQAVAEIAAWLARGGLIYLLALGGSGR